MIDEISFRTVLDSPYGYMRVEYTEPPWRRISQELPNGAGLTVHGRALSGGGYLATFDTIPHKTFMLPVHWCVVPEGSVEKK